VSLTGRQSEDNSLPPALRWVIGTLPPVDMPPTIVASGNQVEFPVSSEVNESTADSDAIERIVDEVAIPIPIRISAQPVKLWLRRTGRDDDLRHAVVIQIANYT
jgi:hypothetical protein